MTLIELDESAQPAIVAELSEHSWDVVSSGAGSASRNRFCCFSSKS
ncbi:hypothetical protein RCR19_38820 [Streptomyces sp. WAC07094]|nr:hypothetical protein [Streptomyces sp. WAC07094]